VSQRRSPGTIGKAFGNLVEHASTSFGASAVLCVPLAFTATYSALEPGTRTVVLGLIVSFAVGVAVAYSSTLALGMYARNTDPGPGMLLKTTFTRGIVSFAATRVLVGLILAVAVAVGMLPFILALLNAGSEVFATDKPPQSTLVLLGSTLVLSAPVGIALFVYVYLQLGLAGPANVLENLSPIQSISRSRSATKGRRAEFFLVLLKLLAVRFLLALVLTGPAGVVGSGPDSFEHAPSNPFSREFLVGMFGPSRPLGVASALVVGISTYLGAVAVTVVSATVLAQFFLEITRPEAGKSLQPAEPVA
jgi:hypothetical protein